MALKTGMEILGLNPQVLSHKKTSYDQNSSVFMFHSLFLHIYVSHKMAKIELYIICVVTIHISSRIMKTMLPPPLMHQKRLRLHQHQYFLCEMK